MDYKYYTEQAYETAMANGFHDVELPATHLLMLVITEVAEMVEADRQFRRAQVNMFKVNISTPQTDEHKQRHWKFCFEEFIKDTLEDEMADACIRLFDLAGVMGFVPDEIDRTTVSQLSVAYFRDRTFTQKAYELCRTLAGGSDQDKAKTRIIVELSLAYLTAWAESENIDIEWHIRQKMAFNHLRSRLHGKKY